MTRRHLWNVARILLGLVLVYVVARQIHLSDRLLLRSGEEIAGRIVSESPDSVTFLQDGTTENRTVARRDLMEGGVLKGALALVHDLNPGLFLLSLASLGAGWLVTVLRWQILTGARGITIPFGEALRLTYIGFFFSNVIPGATGGDVVKAYLATKGRPQKTDVAVSVFVDRIIGLVTMALFAGIAMLFHLGDPRFRKLALAVLWLLAGSTLVVLIFFSRRLRRAIRIDRLLERLPARDLLQEVDRAFFLYRYHKGAVLAALGLSLANLLLIITNNALIGAALGVSVAFWSYLIFAPVASIVTAIPLLPAGWGLGEMAYAYLFRTVGASDTAGVTLSVLYRISTVLWSLLGGLFFIAARESGPPQEPDGAFKPVQA